MAIGEKSSVQIPGTSPLPASAANRSLNDAVSQLQRYYSISALRELIPGTADAPPTEGKNANNGISEFETFVNDLFINTTSGVLVSPDLISYLSKAIEENKASGVEEELSKKVTVIFNGSVPKLKNVVPDVGLTDLVAGTGVNKAPDSPTKTSPTISAILAHSVKNMPATKNAVAVNLFMNAIPAIEMSRCVPHLSIQLLTPGDGISSDGRINGMSLIKFLAGAAEIKEGQADHLMMKLSTHVREGDDSVSTAFESGMELFTSPQTLVNVDSAMSKNNSLRSANIADPFRPFMSLDELIIDVAPSKGMMSYKTAKMELTLHDRTRLHEIANFVKPDLYSKTEIVIEYGWSHPDKPSVNNVYADLLNTMRVTEKFIIVNSALQFDESGQAKISLSLAMKGGTEMYITTIAADENVKNAQKEVGRLAKEIGALRDQIFKNSKATDIRGIQILDAAESSAGQLVLTNDFVRAFNELTRALEQNNSKDADTKSNMQKLGGLLKGMYGEYLNPTDTQKRQTTTAPQGESADDKKKREEKDAEANKKRATKRVEGARAPAPSSNSALGRLKKSVSDVIANKRKIVENSPDPFVLPPADALAIPRQKNSSTVTFGKLMTIFVQGALASTQKFDDVQFVYYAFNANAGKARKQTIGEFPIDTKQFFQDFEKMMQAQDGRAIALNEFIGFLQNCYLDDITSAGYGISVQGVEKDKKTGKVEQKSIKFASAIEEMIKNEKLPDGEFVVPKVDSYIECVPAIVNAVDGVRSSGIATTILRVHIFDRAASPYAVQSMLATSALSSKMSSIDGWMIDDKTTRDTHKIPAIQIITDAMNVGLIEKQDISSAKEGISTINIKGGYRTLKDFIMTTMPSITYGAHNTNVIQVGLRSMQDARLTTVNMIRSGINSPLSPEGLGLGGLPLKVMPAQLDMETLGCPILSYAQQFFVDLDTGTTMDAVYGAFKITHTIGPGKFVTKMSLNPQDTYGRYESLLVGVGKAAAVVNSLSEPLKE